MTGVQTCALPIYVVSKRLTLHKGRNVIRGAVINGPGLSDFCVRFIDENGQPIKDITLEP